MLSDHFLMEFPVAFIERPRLYGDRVTFLVHWEDRSVTEEEVKNLIPGSVFLIEFFHVTCQLSYLHTLLTIVLKETLSQVSSLKVLLQ